MGTYLLAIAAIAVIAVAVMVARHRRVDTSGCADDGTSCATCSSNDGRCGQERMMKAAVREAEYFDDEELDFFAGRGAGDYNDDETEQFRYVLTTMRADEVAAWCNSLTLRGISLPEGIREEVMMFINDGDS